VDPDLFGLCRRNQAFLPLSGLPFVRLDLRYASERNICKRDLYRGEPEAWLHHEAVEALKLSALALSLRRPGWKFRVFDAARPVSVQRQLYTAVAGTPQQAYVADPDHGSAHNYGLAVDVALDDASGREQDFGTPFDDFDPLAQPQLERTFFLQGRLQRPQLTLRRILRACMARGGFKQNPLEWWHFELKPIEQLRGRYPLIHSESALGAAHAVLH
jgi:D-alanyl-D-alanine dipeptidase